MNSINGYLQNKKIIIFGTGSTCEEFLNRFSCECVIYFVDNDNKKHNKTFFNKKIFSPEKLREENKSEIFIIVASKFYEQISKQLQELGYIEGINFLDSNSVLKVNNTLDIKDSLAMEYLRPLCTTYLPWSSAAMRPSGLVKVLNEIILNQRKTIVECGGGISTFLMAKVIKEYSGKIYTIEHNKEWYVYLESLLKRHKLRENVNIIFAPLVPSKFSLFGENYWYDCECIDRKIPKKEVDFLIVDGPPSFPIKNKYSRYPAVPFFWEYLSEDYTILLDDINRQGEQEIIYSWEREFDIKFEKFYVDGGVAIYRKKCNYAI